MSAESSIDTRRGRVWAWLGVLAVTAVALGTLYSMQRARDQLPSVAPLAAEPKPVTVVPVRSASYRETRVYIGTLRPWVEAEIGPQLTSGYVQSVLVRPGDQVQRGDVLATLDCRDAAAASQAVRLAAKALEAERAALAREAARMNELAEDEYVSRNEVDLKLARTEANRARSLAEKARLLSTSLRVDDCILRSPIDGEIVERRGDPGVFIRPGDSLLLVVDRAAVRIEAHAPERDFMAVHPDAAVKIRLLATGGELGGRIARRTPAADEATRTIHFEIDVDNADRGLPVGTTARIEIEVGEPVPSIEVPLIATTVRAGAATLFVVEDGVAHRRSLRVVGEHGASLFLEPTLPAGAMIVTQGRGLLRDGDRVAAGELAPEAVLLIGEAAAAAAHPVRLEAPP